jgi:hypothetical protein
MTSPDPLLTDYYALNPAAFGLLESLELCQSVQPEEWSGFTLVLRLRSSTTSEPKCLRLEFNRVQDLRIGPLEGLLRYFFEIRSIRERQLEDRNYQVVESEHNAFSFFCNNFSATTENE